MSEEITNTQDIIDSRDVIERIEELRGIESEDMLDCDEKELTMLLDLNAEGIANAGDWEFGTTLIRESYFRTYAQEYAEDIGAIGHDFQWPLGCIDWVAAADALQMDYTAVDFDGVTYYVR